jgi:exodeoxyribonuclease V alpha subunit
MALAELEGQVDRIVYRNEENCYTVARLKTEGPDLVTVVGNFLAINEGETLRVWGQWVNHPEYGRQLKMEDYQTVIPATREGIERFLASGAVKGIGPVMAKRLVDKFGLATLDILEKEPHRLAEVEGIGPIRAEAIAAAFQSQKEVRDVMVFLQGHGVSPAYAARIYQEYGPQAVDVVRTDPYRLAADVYGIGFKIADQIAANLGIAADSPGRIRAGLNYILHLASEEGHVYLPREELTRRGMELLEVDEAKVDAALEGLDEAASVHVDGETCIYPRYLWAAERGVAAKLLALQASFQGDLEDMEGPLNLAERDAGLTLAPQQRLAVLRALSRGVIVITGGPGTGKTTIIRFIHKLLKKKGVRVALASPTGRAARRLKDATGAEAKTIHRLLEFGIVEGRPCFQRDEDRPLSQGAVIIDEVSMVDISLMHSLLKAIAPGTRLILVGDVDQLPSVGPGNVLRDIITSGVVETVRLTEIFRQRGESLIVKNAHRINEGMFPILTTREGDFFFIEEGEPQNIVALIKGLVKDRLPRYLSCDPVEDIQVLSPMRRTITGVDNLNKVLQEALNPPNPHKGVVRSGSRLFREGDKVMQIKNNYQTMIFNGEMGRILRIDGEEQKVLVQFADEQGDKVVAYGPEDLDELALAYAVSVHKSQGSEFPAVVLPVTTQHFIMLQRNLLYTALTRAKRLAVFVGTKKAIAIAVKNNKIDVRYSLLDRRLRGLIEG